jgi:hypothetical protein
VKAVLNTSRTVATEEDMNTFHRQRPSRAFLLDKSTDHLVLWNKTAKRVATRVFEHHFAADPDRREFLCKNYPLEQDLDTWLDNLSREEKLAKKELIDHLKEQRRRFYRKLTLCVGTRVMLTVNSHMEECNVSNGSEGVVVSFSKEGWPIVDFELGRSGVTISPEKFRDCKFVQIPLLYGYAKTIAKVQGKTLRNNVCLNIKEIERDSPWRNPFGAGDVCVAVGRPSSGKNFRINGRLLGTHIKTDTLRDTFAEMCQQVEGSNLSSKQYQYLWELHHEIDGKEVERFPSNLRPTSTVISCYLKSGTKPFCQDLDYGGIGKRKESEHYTLEKAITYDLETYQHTNIKETAYFVVARYWENNQVKKQLTLELGRLPMHTAYPAWKMTEEEAADVAVTVDVQAGLMQWVFEVMDEDFARWEGLKGRNSTFVSKPITLIAFNGSNFDFHWPLNYLIHHHDFGGASSLYQSKIVCKGKRVVIFTLARSTGDGAHEKKALCVWDPCLIACSDLKKVRTNVRAPIQQQKRCVSPRLCQSSRCSRSSVERFC